MISAVKDFNIAIQLKPDNSEAYNYRGIGLLHLQEWEKAKTDLSTAQNMGVDIIDFFRILYSNVEDFERKHNVKLPEDIASLLTPQA